MTIEWDVASREAAVVGAAPRVEPLEAAAIGPAEKAMIDEIRIAAGTEPTDNPPEYMRTMIRHPRLFRCQMDMGTALYQGDIPAAERELAILRVGWLCGAPYEWAQHVGIAYRLGMTADVVERARRGSQADGWSAHEAAILAGVEELLADKAISDATWAVLARSWNEAQLIEYVMLVGQYVATAIVQNGLRIRLEGCEQGLARR